MMKNANVKSLSKNGLLAGVSYRPASLAVAAALGLALCLLASGCQTGPLPPITSTVGETNAPSLVLHEGDVLQIKFPGAPEMDVSPTTRGDAKIAILMAGDVKVSGLTTDAAGQAILAAIGDRIKVREVSVSVVSSAFIVYITGAVGRPGKMISDRPLTVFQAVIEAGCDPAKANLKRVKVIRIGADG